MSGFGERLNQRQKSFKKGVDSEDARRKREDQAVQLRKQQREEALQKKRMVNDSVGVAPAKESQANSGSLDRPGAAELPGLCQALHSLEAEVQFQATQQYRKLLSIEQNPMIQEVIEQNVVPKFVEFLKDISRPQLQFEAAWVLTNIASGTAEQTRVVVEHGALPIFVQLLHSPNDDVREQAVWALGNIAGDSPNFRDLVLQSGGLDPLLKVLRESEKTSMMRNATWALSNLCRGKPPPPFEWVMPALATLANLIYTSDNEVLTDACWALSYLSDGPNERIAGVLQAGVCRRLVELLQHGSPLVQTPSLRAVGNIVTGDDSQTQVVLQSGALQSLLRLLSHAKKAIRKETCWTISNITAGNREQIQEVISNGLIPPLLQLLAMAEFDIKKEAAWAVSNATSGGSHEQIKYLVDAGSIPPLCELLGVADTKTSCVALEAIENILRSGKALQQEQGLPENPYCSPVETAEGLTKIEAMQEDPSEEVYMKAMKILECFFPLEDDTAINTDDAAPQQFHFGTEAPQGGFNFGASL